MGENAVRTLAVIGSGMGATMLLSALAERRPPPRTLILLDPTPLSSEAYAAAAPEHLLNTRARVMSLTNGDPDAFTRYAARALGIAESQAAIGFMPRALYGGFLREGLDRAIAALQQAGWRIQRVRARAKALNRSAGRWIINTDRRPVTADAVVLAIGPDRGEPFPAAVSPWAVNSEDAKAKEALVIGAGLTAADIVARLERLGCQGRITLVSPGPGLPLAQNEDAPPLPAMAWPEPVASAAGVLHAARKAVRRAVETGVDWRSVMDAMRPLTPELWAALPPDQRRRLLQSTRILAWSRHRHRLPPQTARTIADLAQAGRLTVLCDRVTAVEPGAAALRAGGRRSFDLIVDARGFDLGFRRNDLVQALIASGAARPCPTGFGLAPDKGSRVGESLYAMGAILAGALLESTAAPEIRAQAYNIADGLEQDAPTLASCPRRQ